MGYEIGTVGFVFPVGRKGERVKESVDIYRTATLNFVDNIKNFNLNHLILRNGNKGTISGTIAQKYTSYQKARQAAEEKVNEKKKLKGMPLVKPSSVVSALNKEAIIEELSKELYNSSIEAYSMKDAIDIKVKSGTSFDDYTGKSFSDLTGGFTQDNVGAKVKNKWEKVESFFIKLSKPLDVSADVAKAVGDAMAETPVAVVSKWFDEQEAIIDALPTMSELGKSMYVVEYMKKDDVEDWFYTGEAVPMDAVANQRIQEIKSNICAYLTKRMRIINDKINDMLEEQLNRIEKCKPFQVAIEVIRSVPSLTTIIKWAKSVIDFFVSTYKLIYSIFKMALQIIELVIIRGPQLINKIMKKVTEFDCPIQFNISVNKKTKES